jgi:chitin disaccharide deacetylase
VTQTTNLLGYPDDARLLIINADDFGMCHASNAASILALTEGVATSTTLMTPCPWAPHAIRALLAHPDLAVGVHLTLVCEFADYRWGPVSPRGAVPSLVDERGGFLPYGRIPELLDRARLGEVETEFRAQIDTVLASGLRPSHLDWHCIADGGREDIFELTVRLAREHGLAMRVHYQHHATMRVPHAHHAEMLRREGLPVVDYPVLDSYHMGVDTKPAEYARLLRELPAGLTEWAVHPSLGTEEARALEPETWRIRRADLDFLLSPEARAIIEAEGITLLDYRALQSLWLQ